MQGVVFPCIGAIIFKIFFKKHQKTPKRGHRYTLNFKLDARINKKCARKNGNLFFFQIKYQAINEQIWNFCNRTLTKNLTACYNFEKVSV